MKEVKEAESKSKSKCQYLNIRRRHQIRFILWLHQDNSGQHQNQADQRTLAHRRHRFVDQRLLVQLRHQMQSAGVWLLHQEVRCEASQWQFISFQHRSKIGDKRPFCLLGQDGQLHWVEGYRWVLLMGLNRFRCWFQMVLRVNLTVIYLYDVYSASTEHMREV